MGDRWFPAFKQATPFEGKYRLEEILGKGAFSEVRKCTAKSSNKAFAAKVMKKRVSLLDRMAFGLTALADLLCFL